MSVCDDVAFSRIPLLSAPSWPTYKGKDKIDEDWHKVVQIVWESSDFFIYTVLRNANATG